MDCATQGNETDGWRRASLSLLSFNFWGMGGGGGGGAAAAALDWATQLGKRKRTAGGGLGWVGRAFPPLFKILVQLPSSFFFTISNLQINNNNNNNNNE